MLAHARRDDRLIELAALFNDLPQALNGVLSQYGVVAVGVMQGFGVAPLLDLLYPLRKLTRARTSRRTSVEHLVQVLQGLIHVADNGDA